MKIRITVLLLLVAVSIGSVRSLGLASAPTYTCPPCNCAHDDKVFHEAGNCPSCGMKLVQAIPKVAIVMFDGVQIIDFAGPYEVFGQAHFQVFTVSRDGAPLKTAMNLVVDPTYSIAESPIPDVLVVPGGGVDAALDDPKLMAWVKRIAQKTGHVLSVCNGAFILAKAGLLTGKSATTFYGLLAELERIAPHTKVVWDRRFVDNGRIVTSAGLSSGIDAALHVVSKLKGRPETHRIALHLEYDWDPKSTYARGALADMHLPRLRPPHDIAADLIETAGDRDRWTIEYRLQSQDERRVRSHVYARLKKAGWKQAQRDEWSFKDRNGRPWAARTQLRKSEGGFRWRIAIQRAS